MYFISPLRINGSAVETIFSCLKYISGSSLSSATYPTSLAAFATQRDMHRNPYAESGYRKISLFTTDFLYKLLS
jgi:hypothetical protein